MKIMNMKMVMLAAVVLLISGCGGHGTKLEFNGGELYYTDAITEEQAKKLGEYLVSSDFFDGKEKAVQIDKTGDRFEFKMVVKEGYDKKESFKLLVQLMTQVLSTEVFDGSPVDIHLCDDQLETLSVVEYESLAKKK